MREVTIIYRCDRRIRAIEIKPEHAYALGIAIGVLYELTDEQRPETASPDPENCATCAAFDPPPPPPPVEVKSELWDSAKLKMRQLEAEIRASSASDREKSNMLHSHSKLCMFAVDAWDMHVVRPAQRSASAPVQSKDDVDCAQRWLDSLALDLAAQFKQVRAAALQGHLRRASAPDECAEAITMAADSSYAAGWRDAIKRAAEACDDVERLRRGYSEHTVPAWRDVERHMADCAKVLAQRIREMKAPGPADAKPREYIDVLGEVCFALERLLECFQAKGDGYVAKGGMVSPRVIAKAHESLMYGQTVLEATPRSPGRTEAQDTCTARLRCSREPHETGSHQFMTDETIDNELGLLRQLAWRVGEWLATQTRQWKDVGEIRDAYEAWRDRERASTKKGGE